MSCGARLAISRLPRWRATSSVPCLNSVFDQNGWKSKSFLIAAANALYASARRSCSVNAQLKRSLGLPCASRRAEAASASAEAPARRTLRREIVDDMVGPPMEYEILWRNGAAMVAALSDDSVSVRRLQFPM